MTVRAPRFSYRHTIQEAVSRGFGWEDDGSDPWRSDTPKERMSDGQNKLLAGKSDGDNENIIFQRGRDDFSLGMEQIALSRFIVPSGNNLAVDRLLRLRFFSTSPGGSAFTPTLSDGSIIHWHVTSSGVLDIEFDTTDTATLYAKRFLFGTYASFSGQDPSLGEIWWTNIAQPQSGVAYGWEDVTQAVATDYEMRSGEIHTLVHGDPRRQFSIRHEAVSGADLLVYDELRRKSAHDAGAFWYDHTDSADKEIVIDAMTSDLTWTPSGTGITVSSGNAPDGTSDCLQMATTGAGGEAYIEIEKPDWSSATPDNWRNYVIQIDVFIDAAAWITSEFDFRIDLLNQASTQFAQYTMGRAWVNPDNWGQGEWVRVQMDIDLDVEPTTPLDLGTPYRLRVVAQNDTAQFIRLANLRIIDKTKQPVYVKIVPDSFRREQENRAPGGAGGPRYTIEFDMIEVTT
jgi:hypothetical protein